MSCGWQYAELKLKLSQSYQFSQYAGSRQTDSRQIQKMKEDLASVEDVDLGAERAEGAPVFSADHTGSDDRQSLGNAAQFQNRIGIVNFAVTERKKVGMNRRGTGGDEDLFTAQLDLPAEGGRIFLPIFRTQIDLDRMRVEKGA